MTMTSATARSSNCCQSRADRFDVVYLRAAQAYMLISMPTGTSTIFGVFQVIRVSQVVCKKSLASRLARGRAGVEPKTTPDVAQVRKTERRTRLPPSDERYFSLGQNHFTLGLSYRRNNMLTAAQVVGRQRAPVPSCSAVLAWRQAWRPGPVARRSADPASVSAHLAKRPQRCRWPGSSCWSADGPWNQRPCPSWSGCCPSMRGRNLHPSDLRPGPWYRRDLRTRCRRSKQGSSNRRE